MAKPEIGVDFDAVVFASDNPFLIPGDNRGSGAIDVAALPYVDWQLDPRTNFEFNGELAFRQYFKHYGNYFTGSADGQLTHRHNEFLTVGAQASKPGVLFAVQVCRSSTSSASALPSFAWP